MESIPTLTDLRRTAASYLDATDNFLYRAIGRLLDDIVNEESETEREVLSRALRVLLNTIEDETGNLKMDDYYQLEDLDPR